METNKELEQKKKYSIILLFSIILLAVGMLLLNFRIGELQQDHSILSENTIVINDNIMDFNDNMIILQENLFDRIDYACGDEYNDSN